MVVERDPPLSRGEINETQLRMLQRCEVPSLLPIDIEECDGQVSLRYSLTGTRMLSEVMRATHWTMGELMGALCKLADTLEECRLIMLDAYRIRLLDEYIFVGIDTQDLRFTYLPIEMSPRDRIDDIERLIVRWMMRVKEPDGYVLQRVIRLVASADFVPAALGRYARNYLAEAAGGAVMTESTTAKETARPIESAVGEIKSKGRSWDLLHPVTGDPQPVSELWGEPQDYRFNGERPKEAKEVEISENESNRMDLGRWRIMLACSSLLVIAVVWKFVYLDQPDRQKLLISACLTLIVGAAALWLWNGKPNSSAEERKETDPDSGAIEAAFRSTEREADSGGGRWKPPGFSGVAKPSIAVTAEEIPERRAIAPETTWITGQEQTALLDQKQVSPTQSYCLVWKSKDETFRIPLQGGSLVIGRSAEAADHVDETVGVSRAHVEFVRESEQWKVKDLGSRNGSRLNDKPMAPYELYPLKSGDCLTLARSQYHFQLAEG